MPRSRHDSIRVSHKEAWSLRQRGYRVTLLAVDAPEASYLGMRVVKARAPFQSMLRPVLNLPTLLQQALAMRADLYLLYNPDTLAVGFALAMLGRRVIYDTAEDFLQRPFIHPTVPRPLAALVARSLEVCERLLARWAVAACVTQRQIKARRGDCLLLENAPLIEGPIVEAADRLFDSVRRPNAELCLIFSGIITQCRGLERMLDLILRLNRSLHTHLILVGNFFPQDLINTAERHPGWRFVDYRGVVPHAESLAWIRRADLGLALLDPVADYPTSSITKFYEYMQYGTPFVASDFPAWRASIDDVNAGLFVDPNDLDGIAKRILELVADPRRLDAMRSTGQRYIREHFNWQLVSRPFVALVDSALADARP
jgi:glycosyltransferase involved in cell wall biosynthesis